ncbi:hypothetical protein [Methylophaga sp.]|uniref:hypothetical protein n=1 Tax=Methylophaga sp. TaxID=2024840 RepID=UPI0025FDB45C|nr:hypothetical protein [Methylophaga sp.]
MRYMQRNRFDIDLKFGEMFEDKVRELFEGDGSIEVKTERSVWKKTGNIAIEIRFKGKPSGISTTDAKWWIHVLSENSEMVGAFIFKVEKLKERLKELRSHGKINKVFGGDDNQSEILLVPMRYIW